MFLKPILLDHQVFIVIKKINKDGCGRGFRACPPMPCGGLARRCFVAGLPASGMGSSEILKN